VVKRRWCGERRSRDTVTCRLRIASAGAARGHTASAAYSADTGRGARRASNVNNARCLPAGPPTTSPSAPPRQTSPRSAATTTSNPTRRAACAHSASRPGSSPSPRRTGTSRPTRPAAGGHAEQSGEASQGPGSVRRFEPGRGFWSDWPMAARLREAIPRPDLQCASPGPARAGRAARSQTVLELQRSVGSSRRSSTPPALSRKAPRSPAVLPLSRYELHPRRRRASSPGSREPRH
jgi:hypothetical protein